MSLITILEGRWMGHPLHPAIVHVPIGVWTSALLFDLLSRGGWGGNAIVRLSFTCIAVGLAAALLAVPSGIVDWSHIKKERPAWKFGVWHMGLNLVVAALFAVNLGLRIGNFKTARAVDASAVLLSAAAVLLLWISACLGGRMVFDHGISVARFSKEKLRLVAERASAATPPPKEENR